MQRSLELGRVDSYRRFGFHGVVGPFSVGKNIRKAKKLAVFSGQYFWRTGLEYSTDEAFVKFVLSFSDHFEKIVFCDAVVTGDGRRRPYVLDDAITEVCPLPFFDNYSLVKNIFRIYHGIFRIVRENVKSWDVVWLPAPHPISLIFLFVCARAGVPCFFFVRQNMARYLRFKNRGLRKMAAVPAAMILERLFRRLSKKVLTFTVGDEMFQFYNKLGGKVVKTCVSLVSAKDIGRLDAAKLSDNGGLFKLLSVGRLDPEKGVHFLIEAMALLVEGGTKDFVLDVVGNGSEEKALREEVVRRRLIQWVFFHGHVEHGNALLSFYRKADMYLLPSLTEGCPQTLFEAMACGVPVIATKVGGIPALVQHGNNGLLLRPGVPEEIVDAVKKLRNDPALRRRLIVNGMETVKNHTMEMERDRMMTHLSGLMRSRLGRLCG